jgi:hypothetical protein
MEILKFIAGILSVSAELPTEITTPDTQPFIWSMPKPKSFESLEQLKEYLDTNTTSVGSEALSDLIMPKNHLPGFEKSTFSYSHGVSDYDGGDSFVFMVEHISENYVYNDKFDSAKNENLSRARYRIGSSGEVVKYKEIILQRYIQEGYIPLKLDNREILYTPIYDINADLLIYYHFVYYEGDLSITAWLPAIAGLNEYDMVKYLDMVRVGGAAVD